MSSFFLYLLPALFIFAAAYFFKNFFQQQSQELKQQIDVYYTRERYMNDLLNIEQLSLKEMNTLHKSGAKIIAASEEHNLKHRALFSQLNINKAQAIIEKAIHKKEWSIKAETYLSAPNDQALYTERVKTVSDLMAKAPQTLLGHELYNNIKKKSEAILATLQTAAISETISDTAAMAQAEPSNINSKMIDINYMKKALNAASPVAMLRTRSERSATGFFVAPQLFLTAHSALPNPAEARNATLINHYQNDLNDEIDTIKLVQINPQKLFITDEKLNYTLVGVENDNNQANITSANITNVPVLDTDNITLIHHPENKQQHISFLESQLLGFAGDFIRYTALTSDGSIGAPVFNSDWKVIALHQARLKSDNPDSLQKEGVKISSIIKDLQQKSISLTRKQQEYLQKYLLRQGR